MANEEITMVVKWIMCSLSESSFPIYFACWKPPGKDINGDQDTATIVNLRRLPSIKFNHMTAEMLQVISAKTGCKPHF